MARLMFSLPRGIYKFAPLAATTECFTTNCLTSMPGSLLHDPKSAAALNDGASIIVNTSVAGEIGVPNGTAYAATKAALRFLHAVNRGGIGGTRIRVNAVSPDRSRRRLDLNAQGSQRTIDECLKALFLCAYEANRTAREIAATVRSRVAGCVFITGAEIPVDGGLAQI